MFVFVVNAHLSATSTEQNPDNQVDVTSGFQPLPPSTSILTQWAHEKDASGLPVTKTNLATFTAK